MHKEKDLFRGLSETNHSCYRLFLQLIYIYRRRNKDLETVVAILSCSALERINIPDAEQILEPCVSKNHEEIFPMLILLRRKS